MTGRGGVDRGRCGWMAGGFAGFTAPPNQSRILTAGPLVDPSSSGQPADRTATRLPSVTSKNGSGMLAASLTGRTAWALFSPHPGHHASAACAWMDAQQVSGHFTPFHSCAANERGAMAAMAAAPVPTRPPTRRSAGLACAASVSQQPLYTQSGPSDMHSSVLPSAICHSQRNSLLPISITSCFGMADTVKHP